MTKLFLLTFSLILATTSISLAQDLPPSPKDVEAQSTTVRGRVYYEDTGRPVKRASIMLMSPGGGGPSEASGLTDANGEFTIKGVAPGKYFAMVNAPGVISPMAFLDWENIRKSESKAFEEASANFESIVITGGPEQVVQIAAKRGGAVSGRIIYENGDPAIGTRVELLRKVEGRYQAVISNMSAMIGMFNSQAGGGMTDDRGVYRFSGLPAGEYIVMVTENAKHTENSDRRYGLDMMTSLFGSGSFLKFFYPDATDEVGAKVLEVLQGQEMSEVNVVIPDKSSFALSGKVISSKDKKPMPRAKIFLQKKGTNVSSFSSLIGNEMNYATSDGEGNWRFRELPRGEYTVRVEPANDSDYYDEDGNPIPGPANAAANTGYYNPPNNNPAKPAKPKFAKKIQEVSIDDKDVADVLVELGYGANLTGTVTTANNKEMPSAVYITAVGPNQEELAKSVIWNYETKSAYASNSARSGPPKINNEFKLENVSSGKINFQFSVNGEKYYVKSAISGTTDLLTSPLNLNDGDSLAGIKVVLADDAGKLKGKVVNSRNEPASGVNVMIVPTDIKKRLPSFYEFASSDATGVFEVSLAPGEYAVLIHAGPKGNQAEFDKWLNESMQSPEKVSIDANGTATITLKKPEN